MCCSVAALAPALAVALGRPFRFSEPNPFCFRGSAMKARTAHAQPPWAASGWSTFRLRLRWCLLYVLRTAQLNKIFRNIDVDRSGFLSTEEVFEVSSQDPYPEYSRPLRGTQGWGLAGRSHHIP